MLMTASAPRHLTRHLPMPELQTELRRDKGPKHASFDGPALGGGRQAVERALKMDKKR